MIVQSGSAQRIRNFLKFGLAPGELTMGCGGAWSPWVRPLLGEGAKAQQKMPTTGLVHEVVAHQTECERMIIN